MPLYCSSAATHCKGCVFNRRKQLEDALCLGQVWPIIRHPQIDFGKLYVIYPVILLSGCSILASKPNIYNHTHSPPVIYLCSTDWWRENVMQSKCAFREFAFARHPSALSHAQQRAGAKYPLDYGQVLQVQGRQNQKFVSQMSCELAKG